MNAELIRVLQSLLDEAVESGLECGCQLAIYQDGELIADLAAGFTSPDRKNPVTPETLFPVFSVGKAIAVTAIHCLVEKGTLSYSTRLGDVWPEVSAQPAPSGFESDSVVCSSTNRNNGRTAWDAKDEIIGRRNCQDDSLSHPE